MSGAIMKNGNYNVVNSTLGGDAGGRFQDAAVPGEEEQSLAAYTVVLSIALHLLSTVFGGGSSAAVMAAVLSRKNIDKQSYLAVLALFLACCTLNVAWSPLEVTDLLVYHYWQRHPSATIAAAKTALYLFLVLIISVIITLLSVDGMARVINYSWRPLGRLCNLISCLVAAIVAAALLTVFVVKCVKSPDSAQDTFVLTEPGAKVTFLVLLTVAFSLCVLATLPLIALLLRESLYWEDGRPHFRQKKVKLAIPEFLISQSNACAGGADNTGGFENSHSGTPSPSTPKLLTVEAADTASLKGGGEDSSPISELPSPVAKPMGNRLGINMAQVLGRRRHTICQISDSSSAASAPVDPVSKAKQYNYVRKFSVDISALQAQLQNPKIFKEAPFQSDVDLTKKPSDNAKQPAPKPLLPLKPLPTFKFDEKEEKAGDVEKKEAEVPGVKITPPPVIMVSNDDTQYNHGEGDAGQKESAFQKPESGAGEDKDGGKEEEKDGASDHVTSPSQNSHSGGVQKPTSLAFKDPASSGGTEEEHISAPTLESAVSEPSDSESEGRRLARLTLLLCVAFCLAMLPVLVTELLRASLSLHAYVNIHTCTLAVSALQTIVYPHLVACSDHVVHRAVRRLKRRVRISCGCRSDQDGQSHVEDSSSMSQV
ncbi:uncharacterized protein LOC101861484 [Aplysia californica]|uniref:Uncharacterized protein LOC101861484 n=1 Tax=Aplysia californica TaxID=6500 RepID=A0ABM1W060_APLCA|nr:uncharacterized protein LOC101861484 [Aplysia californica]XP_035828054.1 uncharacterized protein LOC101861484 [Aplysia californica]